ncbi:hypothetical protein ES703_73875 [subsurface metagenome]
MEYLNYLFKLSSLFWIQAILVGATYTYSRIAEQKSINICASSSVTSAETAWAPRLPIILLESIISANLSGSIPLSTSSFMFTDKVLPVVPLSLHIASRHFLIPTTHKDEDICFIKTAS